MAYKCNNLGLIISRMPVLTQPGIIIVNQCLRIAFGLLISRIQVLNIEGHIEKQLDWLFDVPRGALSIERRVINQRLTIQALMFHFPKLPSR